MIGLNPRGPGDASDPPRPPSAPAPPGFAEVERVEEDSYTLVRYRAAAQAVVPEALLYGLALSGDESELVVQPPGR